MLKQATLSTKDESGSTSATVTTKRQTFWPLLSVISLYFLSIIIANPAGNFPINDDLIYATAVKSILNTGSLHIVVGNAFDYLPVMTGVLVCKFVGFSYDALRGVTIAYHVLGIVGMYLALKQLDMKNRDAAIFTGLYGLNPFMLYLSCTFMTDTPALAITNWMFYFALRAMKTKNLGTWLAAMVCLTAAVSVRQSALSFMPALVLAAIVSVRMTKERLIYLASLVLPAVTFFVLQHWLKSNTELTECYEHFQTTIPAKMLQILNPAKLITPLAQQYCMYGLFSAPLNLATLVLVFKKLKEHKTLAAVSLIAALALTALPIYILLGVEKIIFMPFYQNLFSPPYIGTYQAIGAEMIWPKKHLLAMGLPAGIAGTLFAFCLYFVCAYKVNRQALNDIPAKAKEYLQSKASYETQLQMFLVTSFAFTLMATQAQLLTNGLDRYMCALVAPALLLFGKFWLDFSAGLSSKLILSTGVIALMVYGTMTLSDSMNFNRAQWTAARKVEAMGVSPLKIEAGPEYNYTYGGANCLRGIHRATKTWPVERRGGPERSKLRWWPINGEDYIISCDPVKDYTKIDEVPYFQTVRWKYRPVYILKADRLP